jgi:uncharacterized protein YcaQ
METIDTRTARRLALVRAGLLKPDWTGLPRRARGAGRQARAAALAIVRRFGYLQLDTVSIAGARSHAIVLLSRLEGMAPELGEALLRPGEPLFEYWGHEASWIPIELYPHFAFRRRAYRIHPWYGDVITQNRELARDLLRRIRKDGPLRSADLEGQSGAGWWLMKRAKKVALALWSAGELAIRERRGFQRSYDLTERVIPAEWRRRRLSDARALRELLLAALAGHGWVQTGTLAQTWRLRNMAAELRAALARLEEERRVVPCALVGEDGKRLAGWIRPEDLEIAGRLERLRSRGDRGVLLSPFDPLLWDRKRVAQLFGFDQVLEIFKPAARRTYGYYCLPVVAGDRLVARVDLKAERAGGRLRVLSRRFEGTGGTQAASAADRQAYESALARYAAALGLGATG